MTLTRMWMAVVIAAAGAAGADDSKLCLLLPGGLGLKVPYNESPDGDLGDLINPYGKACQVCQAGVGRVQSRPNTLAPLEGLYMRLMHFESEKGSRYETGNGDKQFAPNSRDYGDTAHVFTGPRVLQIRFARGPYFAEVFGIESFAPRAAAAARQIDQGFRQLAPDCGSTSTAPKLTAAAPPPPAATAPSGTTALRPEGAGKAAVCFPDDPGAALKDIYQHRAWALTQSPEAMRNNMAGKLKTIYSCRALTPELGKMLFADLSMAIARTFKDASCFGGDAGVILQDWTAHHNAWKTGPEYYNNLQWKMGAALRCLQNRDDLATFFAYTSVVVAASLDPR